MATEDGIAQSSPRPDAPFAVTLPVPLSSFVGRVAELSRIQAFLADPALRLITLTGPGGAGKTRLAIEAGRSAADRFADGVAYVDLAPVRDPALVPSAIATGLGVQNLSPESDLEHLGRLLAGRHLLLVLDNFEQVIEAGPAITRLLARAPRLTLLVTSRESLRLSGEQLVAILPLQIPPLDSDPYALAVSDAVALFGARARAAGAVFPSDTANLEAIAAICRRLDGLPLAIELAAVRTRSLTPIALAARFSQRLPLLTGGTRDAPARQRTMRDAIAWSYDLLPPALQRLFRPLAIFFGGCDLEAAEAVAGDIGIPTIDGIEALVDQSLVIPEEGPGGEPRYRLLETIREFGLEQLDANGELAAAHDAHAAYFLALAERGAPQMEEGSKPRFWLERWDAELGNVRAALEWCFGNGRETEGLRLAGALQMYWFWRSRFREGFDWIERGRLEATDASPKLQRSALAWSGILLHHLGDYRNALARAESLLSQSMAAKDIESVGWAQYLMCYAVSGLGDHERGVGTAELALDAWSTLPRPMFRAWALIRLGVELHECGDLDRAEEVHQEALQLCRDRGAAISIAVQLTNLADIKVDRDEIGAAVPLYGEALAIVADLAIPWMTVDILIDLADVAGRCSMAAQSARLFGAAEALRLRIGFALYSRTVRKHAKSVAATRAALGDEAYASAFSGGMALPLSDAIEEALAVAREAETFTPPSTSPAPRSEAGLTDRELEVLRLVAQGMPDREIAETLFMSPRTVGGHVSRILGKLDVSSRAAASAYAVRHGLA